MKLLLDYDWPGNVRELQNVVEQATVLCSGGQITPEHLPTRLSEAMAASAPRRTLQTHERDVLVETLERCGWNKKLAAETLGISRSALYAKIKRYAIETPAA
jgi:two-component system response regulator HydG